MNPPRSSPKAAGRPAFWAGADLITADAVILATGAWNDAWPAQLAAAVPVGPQRGQIIHLDLPGTDTSGWPVITGSGDPYLLAFPPNRIVAGATREDGTGFDYRVTAGGQAGLLTATLARAPGLASATVAETRVGFRPFAPDGLPVLGRAPGLENVWLVTGLGATGLTVGPYAGATAADLACGDPPPLDLTPYDPGRFGALDLRRPVANFRHMCGKSDLIMGRAPTSPVQRAQREARPGIHVIGTPVADLPDPEPIGVNPHRRDEDDPVFEADVPDREALTNNRPGRRPTGRDARDLEPQVFSVPEPLHLLADRSGRLGPLRDRQLNAAQSQMRRPEPRVRVVIRTSRGRHHHHRAVGRPPQRYLFSLRADEPIPMTEPAPGRPAGPARPVSSNSYRLNAAGTK